ncbi:beta-N-acetylhexosaminidase [Lichenibacterium ramalinae]|nr:beta-N-acetylhexosaminidase [Lichenibacterium ramalinae]
MTAKAFVCGCAGTALDDAELAFMAETRPWGLILFRRNVDTPDQLRALAASFRAAVGRADAPVLVDQEGGRVQRLTQPHWPRYPAAARFAALHAADPAGAARLARLGGELLARDLSDCGITVDCAPVLDLPVPGSSPVVGDRAFGGEPGTVAALARAFADGLAAGGVLPVMKHVPGHGRAAVDSHHELPVVTAERSALARDFAPFRALADLPMAMTAHVVFTALDPDRPATTSPSVIRDIVRGEIGFDGLLLSDDLSMQALRGTLGERAAAAAAAGCDILLHCNGIMEEARAVAAAAPALAGRAAERADAALARRTAPAPRDLVADRAAFAAAFPVTA